MNLTARYNVFNELWNKRLRAIEGADQWASTAALPKQP
jgi:hypothetical protein